MHRPYSLDSGNAIYNLLFCDQPLAFAAEAGMVGTPWQQALAADPPDEHALQDLANDVTQDGRVRYLAFRRLRSAGFEVEPKQLLGVIVEVPLDDGLDTLAAYSDGSTRYINHTGKVVIVEGPTSLSLLVANLFDACVAVVNAIGPSSEPRRAPPPGGSIRITFLVSDGFYFGEGPFSAMRQDALGGPVIDCATELLQAVVRMGTS